MKKRLKISKETDEFVIQEINGIDHVIRRVFDTKEEFIECLETYSNISNYDEIELDRDLFVIVEKVLKGLLEKK